MNIIPEMAAQSMENMTETKNKNLILNVEEENSICHFCHNILEDNEIIYFCPCERIYHFTCLSEFLSKQNKTIHNPCEECNNNFKIFYFKLVLNNEQENSKENICDYIQDENQANSVMDKNTVGNNTNNTFHLNNFSLLDTNINHLENYDKFCGLAMKVNLEGMSELISTSGNVRNSSNITTPNSIARIPLSPIPVNNTPYTGRTKTKHISNTNENSDAIKYNEGKTFIID